MPEERPPTAPRMSLGVLRGAMMGLEGENMGIVGGIDVEYLKKDSHIMKAEGNKETNNNNIHKHES